jgi:hypothetical protein
MATIRRGSAAAVREFRRRFDRMSKRLPRGGHLTSYTRNPVLNASVGGATTSQHTTGTAADISYRPLAPGRWPYTKVRREAQRAGLILIDERYQTRGTGPHFHFQLFRAGVATIRT